MVGVILRLPTADYRIEIDAAANQNTFQAVSQSVREHPKIGAADKSFVLRYQGMTCVVLV